MKHLGVICRALLASLALLLTKEAPAQTTAHSAGEFLNSIGVCTHIAQGIDNPTNVANCLSFAGIRNLRDDGSTNEATIQGWIYVHNHSGAQVCLLPINGDVAKTISVCEKLAGSGALLAAEGPNEPNNFPVTYNGVKSSGTNSLPVAWFQRDLYRAVKSDPKLSGIPVFASSEAGGSEPNNCGLQIPDHTARRGHIAAGRHRLRRLRQHAQLRLRSFDQRMRE